MSMKFSYSKIDSSSGTLIGFVLSANTSPKRCLLWSSSNSKSKNSKVATPCSAQHCFDYRPSWVWKTLTLSRTRATSSTSPLSWPSEMTLLKVSASFWLASCSNRSTTRKINHSVLPPQARKLLTKQLKHSQELVIQKGSKSPKSFTSLQNQVSR